MIKYLASIFSPERVGGETPVAASAQPVDDWNDNTMPAATKMEAAPVIATAPAPSSDVVKPAATVAGNGVAVAAKSATDAGVVSDWADIIPDDYSAALTLLHKTRNKLREGGHTQEWRIAGEAKSALIAKKVHQLANAIPTAPKLKVLTGRIQQTLALVKSTPPVGSAVAAFQPLNWECAELRKWLHEEGMLPGSATQLIKDVEATLGKTTDTKTIEELIAKKARLSAIEKSPGVQNAATYILNNAFFRLAQPLADLKAAVEKCLSELEAELLADEREFFAKHGEQHRPTAVSLHVAEMRAHLNSTVFCHYTNMLAQHERMPVKVPISFDHGVFDDLVAK